MRMDIIVRREKGSGSIPGYRSIPRLLRRILRFVHASEHGVLTVVFVSPQRSAIINRTYRKKNHATDVLSFQYSESAALFVGELLVAPGMIARMARQRNVSFWAELTHSLLHGVLHCLGMHHERSQTLRRRVERLEQQFLEKIVPDESSAFHPERKRKT